MIKLLSKNVADKIAAGEVVDRPLSIVKELVENAIDAGANALTVEIKNGGKTYIRVTDNGCGIEENQVELAFLRHATSKITTDEDLNSITTLGFRGEALSSIAAVSRVEIITKTIEAKMGLSLKLHGGELFEKKATGCPEGTTIIVSDLFYNTPARLKFMKTDSTESTLIIDFISKIALAYAHIKIRFINNGTILFSTNGKDDKYSNIVTVYSKAVGEGLIHIFSENETMTLEAYVSRPDYSKTNRKQQIFFVNGRTITNRVMDMAVQEGYAERLFEGRYPVAYLFFKIKPELVDVNIHPNKKEVRFHRDAEVRSFIGQTIKRALLSAEAIPQVKSDHVLSKQAVQNAKVNETVDKALAENRQEIKKSEAKQEQVDIKNVLSTLAMEREELNYQNSAKKENKVTGEKLQQKSLDLTPETAGQGLRLKTSSQNPRTVEPLSATRADAPQVDSKVQQQADAKIEQSPDPKMQTRKDLKEELKAEPNILKEEEKKRINEFFSGLKITGTIFNTYITAIDSNCFYLIDQHAAHERVFYEQLLRQYKSEEKLHQTILTPIVADVTYTIKSAESSWIKLLTGMGFEVEPFGVKSYVIKAIPMFMGLSEAQNMVNYFLENIEEDVDIENQAKLERIITKACKSAIKANDAISMAEANQLLKDLARCDNPYSCPHGRPTFIKMTKYEIEKMFKRV